MAGKTSRYTRSKFFRVALEGATTDGRNIERDWVVQMAKNYNPATYGARVNLEHIRGVMPDSPFKAYGDVIALQTREVDGKLGLYAQIDPTDELVNMNKSRQKIYTSIEVNPKFADTGEAYLVGLAVTDNPASLGTEMLSFSSQSKDSPLAGRKLQADNLFTAAEEVTFEFEEVSEDGGLQLFAKVTDLLKAALGKKSVDDGARFADIGSAVTLLAENQRDQAASIDTVTQHHATLRSDFDALLQKLNTTPAPGTKRPPATGGNDQTVTDC